MSSLPGGGKAPAPKPIEDVEGEEEPWMTEPEAVAEETNGTTVVCNAPPTVVTTELIQKYLDENQQLILAILENQNVGKLAECAKYQTKLQENLMYLAAIADAQPAKAGESE